MERRTSKATLYRRPSSNVVTPNFPGKNQQRPSRATAAPLTVGKLVKRRSSSVSNLPLSNTAGRARASSVGRSSIAQSIGRPSYMYGAKGHTLTKDPRPINDKAYMARMIQEMLAFLSDQEYIGISLTEKELRSPTRNHFIALLSFLYRFIDENYEYKNQPVEVELPALLKPLGYPFMPNSSILKCFNASQYWPSVLAVVSWLREVVTFGLAFDFEKSVFPETERDYAAVQGGGSTLAYYIYMYYCQCFVSELEGKDNFDEFDQMLSDQLDADGAATEIENLTTENDRLKAELQMLESKLLEPQAIEESIKKKKLDLEKMQTYLTQMEDYARSLQRGLDDVQEQVSSNEERIGKLKADITTKKEFISKQGMKPADVQRMAMEKQELLKRIDAYETEKRDLEKARWNIEKQVAKIKDPLDAKAADFTKRAKALVRDMPALRELKGDLDISPFAPNFLQCVKDYIWPWINEVKRMVLDEVESIENKNLDTQNQIAQLKIQVRELEFDLVELEKKIQQREEDIKALPEKADLDYQRLREQKASMEAEYEAVIRQKNMSRAAKEQQLADLTREYEDKKKQYDLEKEKMEEMVEYGVKMNMSRLEQVEGISNQITDRVEKFKQDVMKNGK